MKLASITTRQPHLVRALETLARQADHEAAAQTLLQELSGITVLVARKFTNDRTADGLLEAFYLTTGCISLGISLAPIAHDDDAELALLLNLGAEQVFQTGFRHIRELAALPAQTLVSDFDSDPYIQQRNIKALFTELCRVEPATAWTGDDAYKKELLIRQENQAVIDCAKWLRKKHHAGAVKEADLDANAVIAIAVIFAISGEMRIVARTAQKEIENLIRKVRAAGTTDIEINWQQWLSAIPGEYHAILRERMDTYRNTIIKKILSRTHIKTVVTEIQNCYAGLEQDVEYD